MNFNPLYYRYPSKRNVVYAKRGIACTSNPLATQAAVEIMKKGGNAIDAAVAMAACMPIVEPTGNGIGGDAFVLVWAGGKLYGLNSSGFAPERMTLEYFQKKDLKEVPKWGFDGVTVPGIPAAWSALNKKFGKLSLLECLTPAIEYARNGFAIQPNIGRLWRNGYNQFTALKGDEFKPWFEHFAPNGCPNVGDIWKSEASALTLEEIGRTDAESFYRGALADKISAFSEKFNGHLRKSDLERYHPEWVEPVSTDYKGYTVYEMPPNGHGITVLMALNILKGYELSEKECPETYHRMIESLKLAYLDTQAYVTDPKYMKVTNEQLLSQAYADKRRKLITDTAIMPEPGSPTSAGTVYLCTADEEGNMVSYIQSNFYGFGSGMVVPGTGIALHDRGCNFRLDPSHDNVVAPFKRPYHTIIPGFLAKDGKAVGPFGIMGGFMQPQAHLQVLINTINFGHNPQEALDSPRWQWVGGKTVEVEAEFPKHMAQALADKGHDIKMVPSSILMGRGQIIWRTESGAYVAGTENRCDGHIAGF